MEVSKFFLWILYLTIFRGMFFVFHQSVNHSSIKNESKSREPVFCLQSEIVSLDTVTKSLLQEHVICSHFFLDESMTDSKNNRHKIVILYQ